MQTNTAAFAAFLKLELTPENRRKLETRFLDYFGIEQYREIFALLDLVLNQDIEAARGIQAEGIDRLFLEALISLVEIAPLENGKARLNQISRIHHIGEDYDFFHAIRDEMDWSPIRCVNFLYRTKLVPAHRIAIVTSARNEGINILEWIAHHRLLGIDDFIIYVNDNDDGSSELLNILAAQGIIHVVWNTTKLGRDGKDMFSIQAKVFGHACMFLNETRDFEWLLCSDMDEFLVTSLVQEAPKTVRPLDDLFCRLAQMSPPAAAVMFHWKWFNSQCAFHRRPGLNFQRFRHFIVADHVKTMVRTGHCLSFSSSHLPRVVHGDIVLDGRLDPVADPWFRAAPVYGYGQMNHYWNKSFEEFIAKHLRVWGDRTFANFFDLGNNRLPGTIETMPALWNERLKEEMKMLETLPGVAAELAKIEAAFIRQIDEFDRRHDNEVLFYRHFVKER